MENVKPLTGVELGSLVYARLKLTLKEAALVIGYGNSVIAYRWLKEGVSKKGCILFDRKTNGQVKPHELRPDLFLDPQNFVPTEAQVDAVYRKIQTLNERINHHEQ